MDLHIYDDDLLINTESELHYRQLEFEEHLRQCSEQSSDIIVRSLMAQLYYVEACELVEENFKIKD